MKERDDRLGSPSGHRLALGPVLRTLNRTVVAAACAGSLGACGSDDESSNSPGPSPTAGEPAPNASDTASPGNTSVADPDSPPQVTDAPVPTSPQDMTPPPDPSAPSAEDPIDLMSGHGIEYRGIVNLVDAEAAEALDDLILDPENEAFEFESPLELATRLFYLSYADEYDYLYLISDRPLEAPVRGLHITVHQPPLLGTGREAPVSLDTGPAGLRSAIAILAPDSESFPAFAHEFAHDFGAHVADEFGFATNEDLPHALRAHWGLTSVHGQLGGFDASTLECATPAGMAPPDCTPEPDGSFRFVVDRFSPNTAERDRPFSPFELYMMGLIPKDEVPQPLLRFDGAAYEVDDYPRTDDGRFIVEATGLGEIHLDDIIARHGEVPLLPEGERHFRAAFALVTAEPASREALDQVADWAAIFGGELESSQWPSFSELTGGRATMSHRVGEQRVLGPDDYLDFSGPVYELCDPRMQDCADGLACYGTWSFYCGPPGAAEVGVACETDSDCTPGLQCGTVFTDVLGSGQCAPYCETTDPTADDACDLLCPGNYSPILDLDTFEELYGFCHGGVGGLCDPLAPECGEGQICTGLEQTVCEPGGPLGPNEPCSLLDGGCGAGTVCTAVQGGDPFCQPYCDPAPDATGDIACTTLCPVGAWEYEGYAVCIPE